MPVLPTDKGEADLLKHLFIAAIFLAAAAVAVNAQGTSGESKTEAPSAHTGRNADDEQKRDTAEAGSARPENTDGRPVSADPGQTLQPGGAAATDAGIGRAEPTGTDAADAPDEGQDVMPAQKMGFRWRPALEQSLLFLSVQHGYAFTQPKTRHALRGPFLKDYFRSVRSLHGWDDGGRFFTNYIAHPMEGSLYGFIQVQNDPKGSRLRFNAPGYWRSRFKALAWSAAWSTQFEIGPISQASIGNVGLHGKQTYVDIVMTPTGGLALLLAEDALDKYLVERLERRGKYARIFARTALNPTRTAANLLRFKKPWYRDAGLR